MTPNYVTIPFRGKLTMTADLVVALLTQMDVERILLYNNGTSLDDPEWLDFNERLETVAKVSVIDAEGCSLTQMWNAAWQAVLGLHPDGEANLAILNNDITIPEGFLTFLAVALRSDDDLWAVCPDYNRRVADGTRITGVRFVSGVGVKRPELPEGGMAGWAFMAKVEARREGLPPIDPQFEWFCGDDDLVLAIENCGKKVGLLEGLPVDHALSATLSERPELHPQTRIDVARRVTKWGQ